MQRDALFFKTSNRCQATGRHLLADLQLLHALAGPGHHELELVVERELQGVYRNNARHVREVAAEQRRGALQDTMDKAIASGPASGSFTLT